MNQKSLSEGIEVIAVSAESAQRAASWVAGCERCSTLADLSFESLLDAASLGRGGDAAYVLGESPSCPKCEAFLTEETLVQLEERGETISESYVRWSDLPLPKTNFVLIDEPEILSAQSMLAGCEACGNNALISFDYLLDAVTGCDPSETEYLMCRPAQCPRCFSGITETTMVIPE